MNGKTAQKLISMWCALMLFALVAYVLLRADFAPGHETGARGKLFLAFAAAGAVWLAISHWISRRRAREIRLLEQFATALPAARPELSGGGPGELENLERAMRLMGERVRQLVERANLELSRRETILACMAEGVLAVDQDLRVIF